MSDERTLGSICAGIGGFDIGFERAGWITKWQIEIDNVNRAVLADRFPAARQYADLRRWRSYPLSPVACISFGFPCQDISNMGASRKDQSSRGLAGQRSGLFFEIMEIVREIRPKWIVLENVAALLFVNDCRDFQTVVETLAQCGYVGFGRMLDAQYFGIPQKRRRWVMVAGLGCRPSAEFLDDAEAVEGLPCALGSREWFRPADAWNGYTLTATDVAARTNMGSELFIAEEDGWDSMVGRLREIEVYGLRRGLDAANLAAAYAAGNAFVPAIADWVAGILNRS